MQNYTLETEASYPYSIGSSQFGITGTCLYNAGLGVVKTNPIKDYYNVGTNVTDI